MSGLIFLAILFYAISYIAKEGTAKREAGGAARPQRSEAASAQPERSLRQGTPYAPRSGAYRPAAAPRPEPDVELCMHDDPDTFRPAAPFKEASSGSMNYVSTEGEGTESVPCSLTGHDHPDIHADAHADVHAGAHADVHSGIHSSEEPISRPFLSATDRDSCRRAIIYAEILGRPKVLRR